MITVNGDKKEWEEGLTVRRLLDREQFSFRLISVWVNDSLVDKPFYASCSIPDGAVVQIIHNICGG